MEPTAGQTPHPPASAESIDGHTPPGQPTAPGQPAARPAAPHTVPQQAGPAGPSRSSRPAAPAEALARTGAFGAVRARWLPLWVVVGTVAIMAGVELGAATLGVTVSDELAGVLFYLPFLAWLAIAVVVRARVDLAVMFRWPQLGRYWWVVVGLFPVQLLFSLGAVIITQLVAPGLDDALEDVGQGNLILAVVGLAVLPPLVEETVFRGVLLERLTAKWRVGVAVLVSSVAFGVLHADPIGAGVFGVITCLLYLRTGSLWPAILLHLANNALVLVITRLSGPPAEAPETDVAGALVSAGLLLALSAPFAAWFIRATWPPRGTPTPYQWHELATGLPERHVDGVRWSGATGPVRLTATSSHLVIGAPDPWAGPDAPARPIAVLPLDRVRAAYPSALPGGEQVVLLLTDGSWTSMQVQEGKPAANRQLARIIGERAGQVPWREAHVRLPSPPQSAAR